ncbi:large subunit ribosomal protein L13e [Fonsecaea monophora]|uniref:Large subunit ribosomal protein L13e n=1 Tax=Fonsecaea monophora TaxID=254056 RepID=A0A177F384_9EURO|nr:large subunit ribosomal protein L13e [Fonsecaea monophora]OAG38743.1 large subunit ribosomal protein L13e [Fonsecaea monophora]
MAACCLYGACILSIFLRKHQTFDRFEVFKIDGVTCSSCISSIESTLAPHHGIKRANVDFLLRHAEVAYNPMEISRRKIIDELDATGSASLVQNEVPSTGQSFYGVELGRILHSTDGLLLLGSILILEYFSTAIIAE